MSFLECWRRVFGNSSFSCIGRFSYRPSLGPAVWAKSLGFGLALLICSTAARGNWPVRSCSLLCWRPRAAKPAFMARSGVGISRVDALSWTFFFRPTPSWLPPGRSTRSIACCKLGCKSELPHTHGRPLIERPTKVNCYRPEGRNEVTTK